jgi:hypothetical protein
MATSDSGSQVTADSSRLVMAADYPDTSPLALVSRSDKTPTDPFSAAMNAVFEINELLHQILLHLPLKLRVRSRRVSQAWNHVVTKIGYYVDPGFMYNRAVSPFPFPIYSAYKRIRLNPIFDDTFIRPDKEQTRVYIRIACKPPYSSLLLRRQEFITSPPITKIKFGFGINDGNAVLVVRDGIRIGDLVDLLDKMRLQFDPRSQPFAWFHICDKPKGEWVEWRAGEHCCDIHAESEDNGCDDKVDEDIEFESGDDGCDDV